MKMTQSENKLIEETETEYLDADEFEACRYLAHDDEDAAQVIYEWALLSARGRSRSLDEALCDRFEVLLSRALYRFQVEREGIAIDEHESNLGVGA